jgi:hypothetical protein
MRLRTAGKSTTLRTPFIDSRGRMVLHTVVWRSAGDDAGSEHNVNRCRIGAVAALFTHVRAAPPGAPPAVLEPNVVIVPYRAQVAADLNAACGDADTDLFTVRRMASWQAAHTHARVIPAESVVRKVRAIPAWQFRNDGAVALADEVGEVLQGGLASMTGIVVACGLWQ